MRNLHDGTNFLTATTEHFRIQLRDVEARRRTLKKMGDQPRKHHTVPQFYLAGFTKSESVDGDLWVLDQERQKTWKNTPKQSAHIRDFHEIEAKPDGDPMIFEKTLGVFEGRWSPVVRKVIQEREIPDDESFGDLMMFAAYIAVRVPRIREIQSEFVDRVSKKEIHTTFSTEEGRTQFRKFMEESGDVVSDAEFDEMVACMLSGEFKVDFEQTWHIQQMGQSALYLAPLLSQREWVLWIANDDAPDLICSDSPVVPTWASTVSGMNSPAFGTPNTVVSIPLNRRIALVSMMERRLPPLKLDRATVAAINSATGKHANQLYMSENDVVWQMGNREIGNSNDLLRILKAGA
jgi:hypothetical protein